MLDYEISAADAAALRREHNVRFIDVREPWEVATAPIDGAVPMPMATCQRGRTGDYDPDERLVVFCHAGVRSMNVTVWLRNQGFEQVQSMRGGIEAWSVEVDPSVPRY